MASRRPTDSPRKAEPTTPPTTETAPPPRRRTPREKKVAVSAAPPRVEVSDDARRAMIAEAAYLRAERRGFAPGYEVEDWVSAEAEVNALLKAEHGGTPQ